MENDELTTKELSALEGRFQEVVDDLPTFEKKIQGQVFLLAAKLKT